MSTQQDPWTGEAQPLKTPKIFSRGEFMKRLPDLLRILGAGALIIAMYSFLAKGWLNGNDVFRYLLMLAHTGVLTAIGLASGHWLKEGKGARLLLILALVSIPANFAILGAFIYSQTAAGGVAYPGYVAWTVESMNTALLTTGGSMLLLVPVVLLGFTVLARGMSKKLSLLFLLSNGLLLLPIRDPQLISLLVVALTACTLVFCRRMARQNTAAATGEGITALSLQLLPLVVLAVRSLWLYSLDLYLLTALSIAVFFILRQIALCLEAGSRARDVLDALALIPALSTTLWLSAAILDSALLPAALAFPLGAMASAAMVHDISRRSHRKAYLYSSLVANGLLLAMAANLALFTNLAAALACVATGLVLTVHGYRVRQRHLFTRGILLMVMGLAYQFYEIVHHFDLGSWAGLAVFGIATIVTASLMESRGGRFKPRLESWTAGYRQWDK